MISIMQRRHYGGADIASQTKVRDALQKLQIMSACLPWYSRLCCDAVVYSICPHIGPRNFMIRFSASWAQANVSFSGKNIQMASNTWIRAGLPQMQRQFMPRFDQRRSRKMPHLSTSVTDRVLSPCRAWATAIPADPPPRTTTLFVMWLPTRLPLTGAGRQAWVLQAWLQELSTAQSSDTVHSSRPWGI